MRKEEVGKAEPFLKPFPHMHKVVASLGLRLCWLKVINYIFACCTNITVQLQMFSGSLLKTAQLGASEMKHISVGDDLVTVQMSCVFIIFQSFIHSGCCVLTTERLNSLPSINHHEPLWLHSVAHKDLIMVTWRGHFIFFHKAIGSKIRP